MGLQEQQNYPEKKIDSGKPVDMALSREKVIRVLTEGFSRNRLSLEEFENRVTTAENSTNSQELSALIEDLPDIQEKQIEQSPHHLSEKTERYISVMSERRLRGDWLRSTKNEAVCVMSSQVFDFRGTEIPVSGIEISVKAVMAEVIIIVPPGVDVQFEVSAIMAEATEDRALRAARYPKGTPAIKISGIAVMASINAKCKT